MLNYFKSNAKEMPEFLILDVLKSYESYEKDVKDVIVLAKEISEQYEENDSEVH